MIQPLQCCMRYHIISDLVITAPDCVCYLYLTVLNKNVKKRDITLACKSTFLFFFAEVTTREKINPRKYNNCIVYFSSYSASGRKPRDLKRPCFKNQIFVINETMRWLASFPAHALVFACHFFTYTLNQTRPKYFNVDVLELLWYSNSSRPWECLYIKFVTK